MYHVNPSYYFYKVVRQDPKQRRKHMTNSNCKTYISLSVHLGPGTSSTMRGQNALKSVRLQDACLLGFTVQLHPIRLIWLFVFFAFALTAILAVESPI